MAGDDFDTNSPGLNSPAANAVEIDVSVEDDDLGCCSRALYVGGAGDVKVQMKGGAIVTFRNVVSGCERPWRIKKIFKEGTTATGLVALW
jgi:hypothetical protein